jgi:hypothetical protein
MLQKIDRQPPQADIFGLKETGAQPPAYQQGPISETAQSPNTFANFRPNTAAAPLLAHWSESGFENEKLTTSADKDQDKDKSKEQDKITDYPKIVDIHGEKVNVASAEEEKEATGLIDTMKSVYGVDVSSTKGVEAIKAQYDQVSESVIKQLKTKQWELKELRAVCKALAHYAPILGSKREQSSRKGEGQEVTSVSKVDQAIDSNGASGQLDTSTLGEYFRGSKNFGMFSAGTDLMGDSSIGVFKDNETNLEANATHELAHGLLKYKLDDFIKDSGGYWVALRVKSGAADAEAPITPYGQKSASEDLSETAKYYFIEPETLKTKCPKRYEFVKKVVESWKPKDATKGGAATERK